ncbi:MAG: RnfABCDGE type electron transport complex subunit B [Clostridia bacterium]|nr:RnfABCDGE type electron transport complex subunit B [Clostridia bacterium]
MLEGIITAAVMLGVIGCLIALVLNFAGDKFYVKVNENTEKIIEVLPGNNCGGCGYAGCNALADAIAEGKAMPNACPVGGKDVASKIAGIMGSQLDESARMVAFVHCGGECSKSVKSAAYNGPSDCISAKAVQSNGGKACLYGCMGYGTCVDVCEFDAISIQNGISVVDKEKCRACGKCIKVCPNSLISLVPYDSNAKVKCSSQERGPVVKKQCTAGCLGCTLCTKQCPVNAIEMKGNVPVIDYDKCTFCGACAEKCPSKCISMQ